MGERSRYVTVKIPVELAALLDAKLRKMGYHSRAEMVDDAICRFMESWPAMESLAQAADQ